MIYVRLLWQNEDLIRPKSETVCASLSHTFSLSRSKLASLAEGMIAEALRTRAMRAEGVHRDGVESETGWHIHELSQPPHNSLLGWVVPMLLVLSILEPAQGHVGIEELNALRKAILHQLIYH